MVKRQKSSRQQIHRLGDKKPYHDASVVCSPWQQCHDESSGYSYFWNVQTNEVTWECPPEYMAYLEYLKSASAVTAEPVKKPSAKRKAASEKEEKPSSYLKEGARIPITYFGYSSSESSGEEDVISDASTSKKKKSLPSVAPPTVKSKSQVKSKTSKKSSSEPMGPQLPPNFQFPVEVPISPSQSKKEAKSSKDKRLPVMGPQLPPGYFTEPDGNNTKKDKDSTSVSSLTKDSSEQLLNDKPRGVASFDKLKDYKSSTAVDLSENTNGWEDILLDIENRFHQTKKLAAPIPDILTVNAPSPLSPTGEETAPIAVDETPDSATIKELPSTKHSGVQSIAVSTVSGKPVVEYNFTDSEDEADVVCSSSSVCYPSASANSSPFWSCSNTPSKDAEKVLSPERDAPKLFIINEAKQETAIDLDNDGKTIVEDSIKKNETDANDVVDTRYQSLEYIPEKRAYTEIIDDMFTFSKESARKFGFGFSRSQQLQLENGSYGAQRQSKKKNKNYPMVGFVKSKDILDFSRLNEENVPAGPTSTTKKETIDAKSIIPEEPKAVEDISMAEDALLPMPNSTDFDSNDVLKESIEAANGQISQIMKEIDPKVITVGKKDQTKKDKSSQPSEESITNSEVDDIDQILNNVLKEMVESGEAKSVAASIELKSVAASIEVNNAPDSKKRVNDETTASPTNKRKKKEGVKEPTEKGSDATTNIVNLSTELMEKMTFLVTNHTAMASLSGVLIQVQTRLMDWQAGCLDSKYFTDRLHDVRQYLQHCEVNAVPSDWRLKWNSDHKRYFYVNEQLQISQWMFPMDATPQDAIIDKTLWSGASTELPLSSGSAMQFPRAALCLTGERVSKSNSCTSSSYPVNQNSGKNSRSLLRELSLPLSAAGTPLPAEPPLPVTPPPDNPPLPITPPPDSPPPPPLDSIELEEGEIPDVDMDLEDSNSGDSISFAGGFADPCSRMTTYSSGVFLECPSTTLPEQHAALSPFSIVSPSTSSVRSQQSQSFTGQSISAAAASNWTELLSAPSCISSKTGSLSAITKTTVLPHCTISASSATDDLNRSSPMEAVSSSTSSYIASKTVVSSSDGSVSSAAKKKKSKLRTGLSLKKRNIPSLVQKWQEIEEKQERENSN